MMFPTRSRSAVAVAATLALAAGCRSGGDAPDLEALADRIHASFAEVPEMRIGELSRRLAGPSARRPVLIDVREPAEFAVSHLPGARNIPLTRLTPGGLAAAGIDRQSSIVLYCSVGYRSAMAARRLRRAGFPHASNLRGSIFAWANAGMPLVDARGPTTRVHPYDREWGRYLRSKGQQPAHRLTPR